MRGVADDPFERCDVELAAAKLLLDKGFFAQAISRSYFAAFYAAEAALSARGVIRSKHSGVVVAFNREFVKTGAVEVGVGRRLRAIFELRNEADYVPSPLTSDDARSAMESARAIVRAARSNEQA